MSLLRAVLWLILCAGTVSSRHAQALDQMQLGVIVNTRDPLSVAVGDYYAQQRRIPFQNMIQVSFPPEC